jgi:hypothetical protein
METTKSLNERISEWLNDKFDETRDSYAVLPDDILEMTEGVRRLLHKIDLTMEIMIVNERMDIKNKDRNIWRKIIDGRNLVIKTRKDADKLKKIQEELISRGLKNIL